MPSPSRFGSVSGGVAGIRPVRSQCAKAYDLFSYAASPTRRRRSGRVARTAGVDSIMTTTQTIFTLIDVDNLHEIEALLDSDPMLAHAKHADPTKHHWSALQYAVRGTGEAGNLQAAD